jgi:UDP-N-acetylmuramoylalanine--D-glutamate ligase
LRGKRATVMGLGLFHGGSEVARYLVSRGAQVTVTDLRPAAQLAESLRELEGLPITYVLGEHCERDFADAELVVANPAVPPSSPFLKLARERGAQITSETALFLDACPARMVLVTGTQGKSSTCHTLAGLLQAAGIRAHLGGNIGRSLLNGLDALSESDVVVLEISSYQLEALPPPRRSGTGAARHPCAERVAAVCCVNVLADHLERHGSLEAYERAKRRLLELAGEDTWVVLSGEDPRTSLWRVARGRELRFFATRESAAEPSLREGEFRWGAESLGRVADLHLRGDFQRENTLAALCMARILGAEPERLAASLATLRGLEHRLEDLGVFAGHRVWDNAVSTTPDSTIAALRSLEAARRRALVLLCGGQAKALPLEELVEETRRGARAVVTFGSSAGALALAFQAAGIRTRTCPEVGQAVAAAFEELRDGDELLFSPACASFDAYRNFKDRAEAFRRALSECAERESDRRTPVGR